MATKLVAVPPNADQVLRYEIEDGRPLFFDLDGVLVDSKGLHDRAFVAAYLRIVRRSLPETLPWDEAAKTSEKLDLLKVTNPGERSQIKLWKDKFFRSSLHQIEYSMILNHGIRLTTNPRVVVTSCSTKIALEILELSGLLEIPWVGIVTPQSQDEKKTQTYARALALFRKGWSATQVIAFEDSLVGYEAALNNGIDARRMFYKDLRDAYGRLSTQGIVFF